MRRIALRNSLLALAFVGGFGTHLDALHASEDLNSKIAAACGSVPEELQRGLAHLREHHVSTSALEKKLQEGIAKGVQPTRIIQALLSMSENLAWLDENLSQCRQGTGDSRASVLEFGNEILMTGVARAQLRPVIAALCKAGEPQRKVSETADLYFYLVNKMRASRSLSWSLTAEVVQRAEAKESLTALVGVFQDIQRTRGCIDRPLEIVVKRLKSGAAVRTIKNELQEQFLRR